MISPGRSSAENAGVTRAAATLALGALLFAGCARSGSEAGSGEGDTRPPVVESSLSFRGWAADRAVFREEVILADGDARTSFYSLGSEGSPTIVGADGSGLGEVFPGPGDPASLPTGRKLVADYAPVPGSPSVELKVMASEAELAQLEELVGRWSPGEPLTEVDATLEVRLGCDPKAEGHAVWSTKVRLGASVGSAGLEFARPDVSSAWLSEGGRALLVELAHLESVRYVLVAVPASLLDCTISETSAMGTGGWLVDHPGTGARPLEVAS